VAKRLGEGDSSRRFTVQMLLPGAKPIEATTSATYGAAKRGSVASNYLVRTDPQTRKITSMFSTQQGGGQNQGGQGEQEGEAEEYDVVERERQSIKLASIRELRDEVMEVAHNGMPPLPLLLETEVRSLAYFTSPPSTVDFSTSADDDRVDGIVCESYICWNGRWMETSSGHPTRRETLLSRLRRSMVPSPHSNPPFTVTPTFILIAVTNSSTN
jgi:hypothetical protein